MNLLSLRVRPKLMLFMWKALRRDAPHPRWFVGSGKVDELKDSFSGPMHRCCWSIMIYLPGQQRNLEQALDCRMITRTELILTIFAERARSHEGQLQVELAQLKHAQTRLVRGWTHLDRQKGGIGMRGAGEKQIELDQRMLSERVKVTEQKLLDVSRRRAKSTRAKSHGYTDGILSGLYQCWKIHAV